MTEHPTEIVDFRFQRNLDNGRIRLTAVWTDNGVEYRGVWFGRDMAEPARRITAEVSQRTDLIDLQIDTPWRIVEADGFHFDFSLTGGFKAAAVPEGGDGIADDRPSDPSVVLIRREGQPTS